MKYIHIPFPKKHSENSVSFPFYVYSKTIDRHCNLKVYYKRPMILLCPNIGRKSSFCSLFQPRRKARREKEAKMNAGEKRLIDWWTPVLRRSFTSALKALLCSKRTAFLYRVTPPPPLPLGIECIKMNFASPSLTNCHLSQVI